MTSPVLRPRVTARGDLTPVQVREEKCRRMSVMSVLKDSTSFPHFLSTGQSKYVASHFVVQELGTVQSLLPSLSPLWPTDAHRHSPTLYFCMCASQICACMNNHWCSSLEERQRSGSHHCTCTHIQTHMHAQTQG